MQDTIVCPECKRRLVLPPGVHDILAQCPSCGTRFPSHPPAELEPAWPRESLPPEPPAPDPRPESAPPRYEVSPPVAEGKPTNWAGLRWGGLLVCVLLGIAKGMFSQSGGTNRPVALPPNPVLRDVQHVEEFDLKDLVERHRTRIEAERRPEAGEDADEFRPLFVALGREYRAAKGAALAPHFAPDRMAEQSIVARLSDEAGKARHVEKMRRNLPGVLERQARTMVWDSLEIRNISRPEDDEAAVVTRLASADGEARMVRWWLVRRGGDWLVYDTENLETGAKLSTEAAFSADSP